MSSTNLQRHEAVHVCRGDGTLGSCVAVSAALLPQQSAELKKQQQAQQQLALASTPLLITHGSLDSELPRARVEATVVVAKELGMPCSSAGTNLFNMQSCSRVIH